MIVKLVNNDLVEHLTCIDLQVGKDQGRQFPDTPLIFDAPVNEAT